MNELSRTHPSPPPESRGVDFQALSKGALIALVAGLAFAALAIGGIGIHGALHHMGFLQSLQGRVTLPTLALGTSTTVSIVGIATYLFSTREQKPVVIGDENDPITMSEIDLDLETSWEPVHASKPAPAIDKGIASRASSPLPPLATLAKGEPTSSLDEGIESGASSPLPLFETFDGLDANDAPIWVAAHPALHAEPANTPPPINGAFHHAHSQAAILQEDGDNISLPPDPYDYNVDDDPAEPAHPNPDNLPLFEVFDGNQWGVPDARPMRKRRVGG